MAFKRRLDQSVALTDLLDAIYWVNPSIREGQGFRHTAYGYETHLPEEVRERLIQTNDPMAQTIRFQPDYLITQVTGGGTEFLKLEYKTTTTPRYSERDQQWHIGQVEADPWEYYLRITKQGERMALFIYCAFHPHPLLCDFPTGDWEISPRRQVRSTQTGSYTDYYNLDLKKLRTFHQFMADEFGVPIETSTPLLRTVLDKVKSDPRLQTRHDPNSGLFGNPDYETGFNWRIPRDCGPQS